MFGLAYGDAISFPALFHLFQATPRKRHDFIWRSNQQLDQRNITRMMVPYTHRLEPHLLEPGPTDDTEFALLTLKALLESDSEPTPASLLAIWQREIVPHASEVRSSFSVRAAIDNLKYGLLPPITGSDNPLHYEDSAICRSVPIGLFAAGSPDRAANLAAWDAQITQAEDGIYAAQAMAAAIAVLAHGGSITEATTRARQEFPAGSWIAHVDGIAQQCAREAVNVGDLVLLLTSKIINTVYSFGCAAPETLPAALVLAEKCDGDLQTACLYANMIAKSADSLPSMVGALCGCYQGVGVISAAWQDALTKCRGLCLPFLAGEDLTLCTDRLFHRAQQHAKEMR